MADDDVATRAPESDAQGRDTKTEAEKISGIEGDTKPDQGAASMGVGLCLSIEWRIHELRKRSGALCDGQTDSYGIR